MKKYNVRGMSCAACSSRVEKAALSCSGIDKANVNLLTNSIQVEGHFDEKELASQIKKAGYELVIQNNEVEVISEFAILRKRFIYSLCLLIVLMYLTMGVVMSDLPLITFLNQPMNIAILELLISTIILYLNRKFFVNGFKNLIKLSPNMDSLVALGSGIAYLYSLYMLFSMGYDYGINDISYIVFDLHHLYFETSAMIVTLITLGKMLEAYAKGKTTSALQSLMALQVNEVRVLKDNVEILLSPDDVEVGDIVVLKTNEAIVLDGIVIEGDSAVDEANITGESIPVDKKIGDKLISGTMNLSGYLKYRVSKKQSESTLSQIIKLVDEAANSKAEISKLADKVASIFVPVVLSLALITFIVWLCLNVSFEDALAKGIAVLVISCPCALGLATPVAVMVGSGVGAKHAILFKQATSLEACSRIETVLLDKTGTITSGQSEVKKIISEQNENELLSLVAGLETYSDHPLAKAIVHECELRKLKIKSIEEFKSIGGLGIQGKYLNKTYYVGNQRFISEHSNISEAYLHLIKDYANQGMTCVLVSDETDCLGLIMLADTIKQDSKCAVDYLKHMGLKVVMLSGDRLESAKAIANQVGIDEVIGEVLPQQKDEVVRRYQNNSFVMMVGDGMNDSIALTRADVGVAINSGSDVAIEAADIVLINNSLIDVVRAIRLSRASMRIIKQNLFWAFFYNLLMIPLAAGVFSFINIHGVDPMLAAAAMSLSSFTVVSNALRLNSVNLDSEHYDKKIKKKVRKERLKMEKVIYIEGMMCPHCEATVKKALLAIDGISEVYVSHQEKLARITCDFAISDEVLKTSIEAKDFTVKGIE